MSILTGIDDIQVMLDDYLLRIQTMRGSPFIGAIEADVESWEDKLILMQDILDVWLEVSIFNDKFIIISFFNFQAFNNYALIQPVQSIQ